METLTIARQAHDAIIEHAMQALPDECVGVLLGRDAHVEEVFRLATSRCCPTAYEADPLSLAQAQDHADDSGLEIIGYYHSHPGSAAEPSATDRARQAWPDLPPYYHIIVSLADGANPQLRAFNMRDRAWRPLSLRCV